jgi:hypothetical protein
MNKRLKIMGTFPWNPLLVIHAAISVALLNICVTILRFPGPMMWADWLLVGLSLGALILIWSLVWHVGVWDAGSDLLIGFGFIRKRVAKTEVAKLGYKRRLIWGSRKVLCINLVDGRSFPIMGGEFRGRAAECRAVDLLSQSIFGHPISATDWASSPEVRAHRPR